jgi:hypothetical protein
MPKVVKVTVSTHPPPQPGGPCTVAISVDQDPVPLQGIGQGQMALIHWDIDTPGWQFTSTGIAIANPTGRFTDRHGSNSGKRHTWQRDHADQAYCKYTIGVTDGKATVTWDPWIVNN